MDVTSINVCHFSHYRFTNIFLAFSTKIILKAPQLLFLFTSHNIPCFKFAIPMEKKIFYYFDNNASTLSSVFDVVAKDC